MVGVPELSIGSSLHVECVSDVPPYAAVLSPTCLALLIQHALWVQLLAICVCCLLVMYCAVVTCKERSHDSFEMVCDTFLSTAQRCMCLAQQN